MPEWLFLICTCYVWPIPGKDWDPLRVARCGRCGQKTRMMITTDPHQAIRDFETIYNQPPEPIGDTPWWTLPAWTQPG